MNKNLRGGIRSWLFRIPLTPPVDPERFNDPLAITCGWKSLRSGSANFTTHRLFQMKDSSLIYKSVSMLKVFGIAFIIVAAASLYIYFVAINTHWIMLVISLLFLIVGIVVEVQSMIPIGFDSQNKLYYRGWRSNRQDHVASPQKSLPFNEIHAIQLLTKVGKVTDSSENIHGNRYFYAYELNLVSHSGTRKYVMTYINREQALADAELISELVKAPVWNAI